MEQSEKQLFRNYAWSYFAYHADQRMKTFNFFLVAAGLLSSGIATLFKGNTAPKVICPLARIIHEGA